MSDGNEVSTPDPDDFNIPMDSSTDLGMLGWSTDLNINRALAMILLAREIEKLNDPTLKQVLAGATMNLMIPMSPPRGKLLVIEGGKKD